MSILLKGKPSPKKGMKWKINPETGKREFYFGIYVSVLFWGCFEYKESEAGANSC